MFIQFLLLALGLVVLVWSADKFVYGASGLAKNLGVSPLVIGLTIVAMGSSAPEMMVAASASLSGNPDVAIGNAIGSNITNITLVLGVTALLKPLLVSSTFLKRELPIVLFTSLLGALLLANGDFVFWKGLFLSASFFITITLLTWFAIRRPGTVDPMIEDIKSEMSAPISFKQAFFWTVVGITLLILSSQTLVKSAVEIAIYCGVSDLVIGLTIIAIGTSLPELAASVASVLKGESDLAIGNIVGSNIFNILAVLAIPALLAPGKVNPDVIARDIPSMLFVTVLLLLISGIGKSKIITRLEGGILLFCFVIYQILVFYTIA